MFPRFSLLVLSLALTTDTALSNDSAWSTLDAEVEALANALRDEAQPIQLGGLLRFIGAQSSQNPGGGSPQDLGGVLIDSVRIDVAGQLAGWDWFFEGETVRGNLNLLDGWMRHSLGQNHSLTVGQFRPPILRSALMYRGNLLLLARTRNGGLIFDRRDQGVMLESSLDDVHLALAAQNGADSTGDDLQLTGRVQWDAMGNGVGPTEGAFGAGQGTHLTLGAAITDDAAAPNDGHAIAAEAALTIDRFSVQAEWIDYEEDFNLLRGAGTALPTEPEFGGTHPWSLTASALVVPDKVELAARVDEFDDEEGMGRNRTLTTFGFNFFIDGHDLKWQLNYSHLDSTAGDEEILAIGVTAQI